MTTRIDTTELSICSDCYMYHHNGDDGFSDYVTPEMQRDIKLGFDKLGNILMSDHLCPHGDDCDHAWDWGCVCNYETYFSWSPCDICESRLGGDRHDVDIIQH